MDQRTYVTAEEALRLRGDGTPDIVGYKALLQSLGDGTLLRIEMGGQDARSAEEANFTRAARELGIEVGFSQLREEDNVPYLLVTRNPNTFKPHIPAGIPEA